MGNDRVVEYLLSGGTHKVYKQVSTPYCMLKLTSRVTDLSAVLLKTLVALSKHSSLGVLDYSPSMFRIVYEDIGISRISFSGHIRELLSIDAIRKEGDFLLINPMYVAIGRRTEVNMLYELYHDIPFRDSQPRKRSKKLKGLGSSPILSKAVSSYRSSLIDLVDK